MTQFPDPVEADRRLSAQMRFWLGVVGLVLFVVSTPLQLIYGDGLPWSGVILLPLSIGLI